MNSIAIAIPNGRTDTSIDAITWHPNGKVFVIVDRRKFCKHVLPKYFRKSKYTSFTRKLNRWNFIRLTRGRQVSTYYHEFFQKGKDALCTQMYCNNDRAKFAVSTKTNESNTIPQHSEKDVRKSTLTNSLAHVLPYEHEPSSESLTRSVEAELQARSTLMQNNLMKNDLLNISGSRETSALSGYLTSGLEARAALLQRQSNLDKMMQSNLITMALAAKPPVLPPPTLSSPENMLRNHALGMQHKQLEAKASNMRLQLAMLQRARSGAGFNFCSAA